MIIKVEQKHIDKGTPNHIQCCAIALAIQDCITTYDVYVASEKDIDIGDEKYRVEGERKEEIREFIENFDEGKKELCKPIEFEIYQVEKEMDYDY